eukprot:gene19512-26183_t
MPSLKFPLLRTPQMPWQCVVELDGVACAEVLPSDMMNVGSMRALIGPHILQGAYQTLHVADGVDREVKAVDSEHSKNIDSDAWRLMQLHKHTANQLHPWSKFFTGNNLTLGVQPKEKGLDIRQGVEDFYNKWYSSNLMRLAVISRHSLDELEAMVRADFSSVKNKELEVPKMPVIPVRDSQSLEFAWQVPPSTPVYRASPLNYLSHLLGHEGTGSLFAVLKQLGWASSLVAGESSLSISSSAFFYEGFNHPKEISSLLFKYLSILKGAEGVNEEIFKEMQVLQRLRFDFRDKMVRESVIRFNFTWNMKGKIFKEMQALQRLRFDFRDKMSPNNAATGLSSALHECNMSSPYNAATGLSSALQLYPPADLLLAIYHVPMLYPPADLPLAIYHVPMEYQPDVIREAVEMMSAERFLTLPSPVPCRDVTKYGTKYSLQGIPEDWLEAWASTKTDSSLHLPEPNPFVPTDFTLHTEEATGKGEPPVLAADIPGRMGIYHKLIVSGYNHKLLTLLDSILNKMVHFEMKEDRFAIVKENVAKEYTNIKYQQPYSWVMYRKELLVSLKRWQVDDYIESIKDVTPEDVTLFVKKTMLRCFVQGLVVGNMPRAEVVTLSEHICKQMTEGREAFKGVHAPRLRPPLPLDGTTQLWLACPLQRATVTKSSWTTYGPADWWNTDRESPTQSEESGSSSIVRLLTMFEAQAAIEELRKTKLEKPKTLGEITRKMWHEVMYGTAVFNRQEAEVAELDTITPEELREFATSVLGPETRRKLIVAAQGSAERIPASETPEDKAPPASEDKAPPAAEDKAPPAAEDKAPPAAEDKAPPADPPSADAADAAAADKSAKNSVDFTRGGAEALFEVDDISMFKRSCEVWPNVAASYLMKRKEQQKK